MEENGPRGVVGTPHLDSLIKAYRLYQRILKYPLLQEEIRRLFLAALEERGITNAEAVQEEARRNLLQSESETAQGMFHELENALIDLYFAVHFSPEEIENYINLARKQESFHRLHEVVNREDATSARIKKALKDFCDIPQGSLYISPSEAEGVRVALINHFISNQLPFIGIAKNHITIRDIDELIDHSYWNRRRSGKIGGKAAGMFLAYKITLPRLSKRDPELEKYVSIPESYYFNSGNLSDFLDYNRLYSFHSQKYKTRETIEEEYRTMSELFKKASFPPDVVEDFRDFLDKVGEHPLILRSSSLLEDNFGYAFSGKYDSVFLANQGDLQTRLNDFMWGLKRVLMSTFSPAAILYRRDRNLIDFDERMSVLVQKVVGRRFGPYFFPLAGGVAFSQNAYAWTPKIVREEGMVRLALGLGTRAVDQIDPDYPRMVPLSHPTLRPEVDAAKIRKYSQKLMDVINLETNRLETVPYLDLFAQIDYPDLYYVLSTKENDHIASPMFKSQPIPLDQSIVTFENFLTKTDFVPIMRKILKKLERSYGRPVDVEFAWDCDKLYILQCRSQAVGERIGKVTLPKDVAREQILFTNNRGVANGIIRNIEYVAYVDPKIYMRLSRYEEKLKIGRVVGAINRAMREKRYALFGPPRWGSSDINQGVKVGYEDINHSLILGEIAFKEEGTTPEVSYGTHFFNDLVEAKIMPVAVYPDESGLTFDESFLLDAPNLLGSMVPEFSDYTSLIHIVHVPSCTSGHYLHVFQDAQEQKGIGFFGHLEETD